MNDKYKEIERSLSQLVKLRTTKREQKFKVIVNQLYRLLKEHQYKHITKKFLNGFFNRDISNTTRQDIVRNILKELLSSNRIKTTQHKKMTTFFRVLPLYTNDYNSYGVLMAKNGFKTHGYNFVYDKKQGIPKRILKGITQVNNTDNISDSDLLITKSDKPRFKQGCFSNSSISIRKVKQQYNIKVYEVL